MAAPNILYTPFATFYLIQEKLYCQCEEGEQAGVTAGLSGEAERDGSTKQWGGESDHLELA